MLSRFFKVILLLFMVAPVIVVLYDVLAAPKVLTRENNKGNEVKQLDRLMNTTRYAEQIRKAGYQVDDYDLKMMDRIPKLETKGETKFIIQSPTNTKEIFVYINGYRNRISFDKDMNLKGSLLSEGEEYRTLNDDEKEYYKKMILEKINRLLDDVYKAEEK